MQKELLLVIRRLKQWIKKNKVVDIVIFGSSLRGNLNPKDIDMCIIIKDSDGKKSIDLVDSLGRLTDNFKLKFHINVLTSSSFISGNTLAKTLLNEGYSIRYDKDFSSILGFENKSLFVYVLKHFFPSKRVKFHYMLKGRYGSRGILKDVNGKFIGAGSILVPTEKEDLLKAIFDKWDVKYKIDRVLIS